MVALLTKEENARSETGGEDYVSSKPDRFSSNPQNVDIFNPGGTGSSQDMGRKPPTETNTLQIRSYMDGQLPMDSNNISMESRRRRKSQLERAVPVDPTSSKKACANCTIF